MSRGGRGSIYQPEFKQTAIPDRLLHHSYPFLINGPSYRMKELTRTKVKPKKGDENI